MAKSVLVFPPLVERSFGQIYPSTAVLAAYLESHGLRASQVDLNSKFLSHILSDEELATSAGGKYVRSRPSTSAAARWTQRHLQERLLSRSAFGGVHGLLTNPLDNVLRLLALPYTVDPDRSVLDGTTDDQLLLESYRRFFNDRVSELLGDGSVDVILGVSVPMGPQLLPALILASIVRSATPTQVVRIVLGGPALSLLGEPEIARLLERNPAVDCVVRFDGEYTLRSLAEQVAAGDWSPENVPGTSVRRHGVVMHRAPVEGPALNALPTPLYSPEMVAAAPFTALGVTQARGCYWGRCDYCDFVEVYKGSPRVRARSPELVVQDIRRLVGQTGATRYRVITDSIPPAFARRFSTLLCESRLEVTWSSFAMVDERFDIGLLRLMAESGCEFLVIGLESMVTRALKLVHKSADREENQRFIRDARAAGIRLSINLIPNLPTTTRDEALEGLRDLEELADCVDKVSVFDFEATRSSRVGQSPSSFGLVPVDRIDRVGQAQLALNTLPVVDPAMTSAELGEVFRKYRAFAARVNARSREVTNTSIDRSYIEVLDSADGPAIINFATLERIQFPPAFRSPMKISAGHSAT